MHELPFADASFDHVMLFNILTQATTPARVARRGRARATRPGGNVVVVTLAAHDHPEVTASYRDLHPGFAPAQLRRLLQKAGLVVDSVRHHLPREAGPALRESSPPSVTGMTIP